MRTLTLVALMASMSFTSIAAADQHSTDAQLEGKFYVTAHSALAQVLSTPDDADYERDFHGTAKAALDSVLVQRITLAPHDDATYEHLFYQAAKRALRAYDAPDALAQNLN